MASKHNKGPPGASGAPKLDLENYKKFYGNGIPRWSPYYRVTVEGDLENQAQILKFKSEGHGSLPLFHTHEELATHLVTMPDHKLNRMRDFGCGKPHWSPLYSEPAYKYESRAIEGDRISMQMTVKIPGEDGYVVPPPSAAADKAASRGASAGGSGSSKNSARDNVPEMSFPDPMSNTQYVGASAGNVSSSSARGGGGSKPATARSSGGGSARARQAAAVEAAEESEAARIEALLLLKQNEIKELRELLKKTKGGH